MRRGWESVVALVGLVGCGGPGPHAPAKSAAAVTFPTAESIADVQPIAIHSDTGTTVSIDRFEIDPTTVPALGSAPTQTDEQATHALAPKTAVSAPLACAARAMARIVSAKNAAPTESLRNFAVARCDGSYVATSFTTMQ